MGRDYPRRLAPRGSGPSQHFGPRQPGFAWSLPGFPGKP